MIEARRRNSGSASLDEYHALEAFDRRFLQNGVKHLAGVDEAGRGALAGPVVAAAVILPRSAPLLGVNDSKKVKEIDRERLFSTIIEEALAVGIASMSPCFIDENNILVAALSAMSRAVSNLGMDPDLVIVDGRDTIRVNCRVLAVKGGDGKSLSVAAASIVAKVTRDRMMRKLHNKYPSYNFLKNKGYGTREHIEAIERFGLVSEHRKSYHVKSIEKIPDMF